MPSVETPSLLRHQRQVWSQILIPMIVVIGIGLAAGGLVIAASVGGTGATRLWADVAIIWLIAPLLLFALAGMVVLAGLIYLLARLTRAAPRYTSQTQLVAGRITLGVQAAADAIAKPFLWLKQAGSTIRSFGGSIRKKTE